VGAFALAAVNVDRALADPDGLITHLHARDVAVGVFGDAHVQAAWPSHRQPDRRMSRHRQFGARREMVAAASCFVLGDTDFSRIEA
jgi:hypothetical protein